MKAPWYTYIVRCNDDTLYTGITTSLQKRIKEHNSSTKGAKYTKARRPVVLAYSETFNDRAGAAKREWEIKHLPLSEKKRLADNLEVIRRPVKHARLQVRMDQPLRIVIPLRYTNIDLQDLLHSKKSWIEKTRKKFDSKCKRIPLNDNQILYLGFPYTFSPSPTRTKKVRVDHRQKTIHGNLNLFNSEVREKWYRGQARQLFTTKLETCARQNNFSYHKLYIRSQKTKWGTCSGKKIISLNYRLIKAPEFVIDYMVVHELVHTRIMNHSKKFWAMLGSLFPDYHRAEKWLDEYGNNL